MRLRATVAAIVALAAALPSAPQDAGAAGVRHRMTWKPSTATSWPITPGGDNFLSGYNPTETPPAYASCHATSCRKTGDADGPWLEWQTKLTDLPTGSFPLSGIIVDGGMLYAAGGATNSFIALDIKTGLPVWRFSPDPRTDGNSAQYPGSNAPELHNGLIYVTFSNGYLYALDAKTGRKVWSYHASEGYRDTTPSRPGDADHPARAGLDSYQEDTQLNNRAPFSAVHPGVDYPNIHGKTAYCDGFDVVTFMTLSGWVYGIDGTNGRVLWKRYADAPEFPGELVWPEYKNGGALTPENSSLGSSTRRFEAVPGVSCGNQEVQVLGSDGHLRFLDPRTGKQGRYHCGYSHYTDGVGASGSCQDEGGNAGDEYERLDVDANGNKQDMCAADGFNCDLAVGLGIPPLAASDAVPANGLGADYLVTTLDSRIIRLRWDTHYPVWRRSYDAPFPFETANTMPLVLPHVEHGFITQATVGSPMAIDPDVKGQGARPILYAASQDGHLYVISVNERESEAHGLRSAGDPLAPALLARVGIQVNHDVETPYTPRNEGGPWDYNQAALYSLVLGGNVLYVATWDNKITGFDVRDPAHPREVWEYQTTWDTTFQYPPFGRTYSTPLADVDGKIWSAPALVGGHLYFAANDGSIYSFNLHHRVKTVRNLVVLGSGLVPFLPQYTQPLGAFDRVWTPDDWYKNQIAPKGYRLPAGATGAGVLLLANLVLFWWFRRRGDISIEVRQR